MKGRKENTTKKGDIKLQSCKRLGPATTEWLMVHTNASLHIDSEKFLRRSESGVRLGLVFKVKQISTIFDEVGARSIQLSRNRSEAETSKHAGGVYGAPCPKSSSVVFTYVLPVSVAALLLVNETLKRVWRVLLSVLGA